MLELFKTRLRAAIRARKDTDTHFHMGNQTILHSKMISNVNCKDNIHCNKKRQPSFAAVEGEGRIVLHHEPNQEQFGDSTEGLRISGRRHWFIIMNKTDFIYICNFLVLRIFLLKSCSSNVDHIGKSF